MKQKRTMIFDFDGTICDSGAVGIEILNQLSSKYGYRALTPEAVSKFRNLNSKDSIRFLGISLVKLPLLVSEIRKEMNKVIGHLHPFEGIPAVLRTLAEDGFQLGILTSNSEDNVRAFIEAHDLDRFVFVQSGSDFFGKTKQLNRIVQHYDIELKHAFMVGDETRDIEAAKACGIHSVGVSWGYSSKELLEEHPPAYLIDRPEELISIVAKSTPPD